MWNSLSQAISIFCLIERISLFNYCGTRLHELGYLYKFGNLEAVSTICSNLGKHGFGIQCEELQIVTLVLALLICNSKMKLV